MSSSPTPSLAADEVAARAQEEEEEEEQGLRQRGQLTSTQQMVWGPRARRCERSHTLSCLSLCCNVCAAVCVAVKWKRSHALPFQVESLFVECRWGSRQYSISLFRSLLPSLETIH